VDAFGNAYVTGSTQSADFPIRNAFQPQSKGGESLDDAFVAKLSPGGARLLYSSYLGGSGEDEGMSVALDSLRNVYVMGFTSSSDLRHSTGSTSTGGYQRSNHGSLDVFLVKIGPPCTLSKANPSVTLCAPADGGTVRSPVRILAGTTDSHTVGLVQIYIDGTKIYQARNDSLDIRVPMNVGTRRLTVQALDDAKVVFRKSVYITVSP